MPEVPKDKTVVVAVQFKVENAYRMAQAIRAAEEMIAVLLPGTVNDGIKITDIRIISATAEVR